MYDIILALLLIEAIIAAPRFPFLFLNSPAIIAGVQVVLALFALVLVLETSIIRTGLNAPVSPLVAMM